MLLLKRPTFFSRMIIFSFSKSKKKTGKNLISLDYLRQFKVNNSVENEITFSFSLLLFPLLLLLLFNFFFLAFIKHYN